MDTTNLTEACEQVLQEDMVATLPPAIVTLIAQLRDRIEELEAEVSRLQQQAQTDSRTSSKPPSTDQSRRARQTHSRRTRSGRASGGQRGHPGSTLPPTDTPDHIVRHSLITCPQCGEDLSGVETEEFQQRQVVDLPPIRLDVTEHQAETKCCPHCQTISTAAFPAGVESPVQYGERLKGLLVYLHQYQVLPYQRSCELIKDVCGQSVSEGTLANANAQCHETLASVEQAIIQHLQGADVVNFDETSLFEQGERRWLHSASTEEVTYYFPHAKRGKEGSDAAGVLPEFHGRAVHDHWATYQTYQEMEHAFCNAHHLRELDRAAEQDEAQWAAKMRDLLCRIKARVEEAKAQGVSRLPREEARMFFEWYCSILFDAYLQEADDIAGEAQPPPSGRRQQQSKEQNLRDRLYRYAFETLAFMYDFRVPFDNNLAERDIRMTKVKQKISGGFRSSQGLEQFCRIRGFISTIKKQGGNVLEALRASFQDGDMLQFVRLEVPE
jgi:transposase